MAQGFWEEVAQTGATDPGYLRSGRLQPILDEASAALAQQRAKTAKALWGDSATWDIVPLDAVGWTVHSPTGLGIFDTLSALVHPRRAVAALTQALQARGVTVVTSAADAGQVLWATGVAGLEALNENHHRLVGNGVKGQAAVLEYGAPGAAQLFADGVHFIPHLDGTVAIGSTSEREFDAPATTDAQLEALIDRARSLVPALKDAPVVGRWAGVRPRARSRAPMLGAWPGRPGHFIANGGFKIGFGMAPKIANVMADLILNDIDTIPQDFRVGASL